MMRSVREDHNFLESPQPGVGHGVEYCRRIHNRNHHYVRNGGGGEFEKRTWWFVVFKRISQEKPAANHQLCFLSMEQNHFAAAPVIGRPDRPYPLIRKRSSSNAGVLTNNFRRRLVAGARRLRGCLSKLVW